MASKPKWKDWFSKSRPEPPEGSEQPEDRTEQPEDRTEQPEDRTEQPEDRAGGQPPLRVSNGPREADSPPVLSSSGERSTFASKPWWKSDWWLLDPEGHSGDVDCDVGTVGDLAVAAASIRGNSHRVDGSRCEDSFALSTGKTGDDGQFLVVAVGDGLGSADHSSYGSRRATYLFANKLASRLTTRGQLDKDSFSEEAERVRKEVIVAVKQWRTDDYFAPALPAADVSTGSLETTLTFAVVPAAAEEGGIRDVLIGFVGDSPLFKLSDGTWTRVPDAAAEDLIDPTTQGLHSGPLELGKTTLRDDEVLVLATDGIGNFVRRGDEVLPVGDYLAEALRAPIEPAAFVTGLMFDFVSADDDRTAVVCWPNRQQHEA